MRRSVLFTCAVSLLLGLAIAPAGAQSTRSFVSGVGDDANSCSRTAPCKTFAGAISSLKTFAGGEINCLDSGGFGGVTITVSITISCENVTGGVLVSNTNGITINGAGITVYLRGLDLEGLGLAGSTSGSGLSIANAAAVYLSQSRIHAFPVYGISVTTASNLLLSVTDTIIADNGNRAVGGTGGGIDIAPTGSGTTSVALERVGLFDNTFGIKSDSTSASGAITTSIADSLVNGNTNAGIASFTGTGHVLTMVDFTTVANNGVNGIRSSGGNAVLLIGSSVVTGNGIGAATANSGSISSYKTNQINGNTSDGTPITQQGLN